MLVIVKSFVRGYFRKGKWVKDYTNKVTKKPEKEHDPDTGDDVFSPWQWDMFGSWGKSAQKSKQPLSPPPKPKAYHPQTDDHGKPVPIYDPTDPTDKETWRDPSAIATFVVDGDLPTELNGIPFTSWDDHPKTIDGWDFVDGQMDDLDEPPFRVPHGKDPSAGVVIEEPDGRIWVIHPTNQFAGYKTTFPKGHTDDELSLQAAAIKECFEETGLKVEITGFIGDVNRTLTVARYYRAKRVGGSLKDMGWESQAISLVPAEDVPDIVNQNVDKHLSYMAGFGKAHDVESISSWKHVGHQKGSNPGGFFKDTNGTVWYCKFPKSPDHAANEILTAKLYEAAGVAVPELKMIEDGGDIGVASKVVDGVKQDKAAITTPGKVPGVFEGFAADAWLADWDSVGLLHDNLLVDKNGNAIRIDVGGSLLYRAQGAPKGKAFGDKVAEIESLRDPKNHAPYSVFGKIPLSKLVEGVEIIAGIPDREIRGLVEAYGPGGKAVRKRLADRLIARKNDLIERFLQN